MSATSRPEPVFADARTAAVAGTVHLTAGHRESGGNFAMYALLRWLTDAKDPAAETKRLLDSLTVELQQDDNDPALIATGRALAAISAVRDVYAPGLRSVAVRDLLLDLIGDPAIREAVAELLDETD